MITAKIDVQGYVKRFDQEATKAQMSESFNVAAVVSAAVEHAKTVAPTEWREQVALIRGQLKLAVHTAEAPDLLLPHKHLTPGLPQRLQAYHEAIQLLNAAMNVSHE